MLRSMCCSFGFFLIALGSGIGARPMHGQTISFFREFSTPQMDRASAIVADATGVYLFGERPASDGSLGSAAVSKFDSRGNQLWTRPFSAPVAGRLQFIGVASEPTGIYVLVGVGDFLQFFIRKYSAEGNELWTRELGFSAPGTLAVDATGVYVVGRDFPPNFSYLRKYSPDGVALWTTKFGGSQVLQSPHGLAVDRTGIYLFGIAAGGVTGGSFLRKYDLGGNELWTRESFLLPGPLAAAVPTGFYLAPSGNGSALRRYDSDGNEVWKRQSGPATGAAGVVADVTGVYVVGITSGLPGQCRSGSGYDSFVRKYDAEGVEQWTREFGASDTAFASGVAVDSSGVYVAGQAGPFGFENFDFLPKAVGANRAFLARFDKSNAPVAMPGPRIFPDCVVNAASYVGGGVAPGEIVTLFGSAMGPSELVRLSLTEDRRLATILAETRILFNGVPAPLLYVSDKQSSAIVPYAAAGKASVDVQVEYKGVQSEAVTAPVLTSRPGIFGVDGTGQGQGAILNEDGSPNSPSNPAQRGSIITLYGTGGGEAAPGVVDGQIVSGVPPRTSLPVSAIFDLGLSDLGVPSKAGEVLYAGGVSGAVAGLLQLNVRVPANAVTTGNAVPFVLIIGSHWTVYQVTVALR
jgi:uncharacterized protein (TIGR03437 family)